VKIMDKGYDEWEELAETPARAARVVADWMADVLTVVRVLHAAGVTGLLDGPLYWHVEQAYTGVTAELSEGAATPATVLTMAELATWAERTGDREAVLTDLADEFGCYGLRFVLNQVSVNEGLRYLGSDAKGTPQGHIRQAHRAVLTLLTGSPEDAEALDDLWAENFEDTTWNREVLARQKRAASVIVTVAADGDTATVVLPGGLDCKAGRVGGDSGLFWVADEMGDVIGRSPTWLGVGELLAKHYGYPPEAVELEYAEAELTGVATPVSDTSEKG
jgi:hypothetical protein